VRSGCGTSGEIAFKNKRQRYNNTLSYFLSHRLILYPHSYKMADQLNLPQLLAVVLVGILAIRWYFTAPTPSEPTPSRIPIEQLEQIQQMFPQLEARTILFNLQRNGDNISAFTEHVLSGRTLAIVSVLPSSLFPLPCSS